MSSTAPARTVVLRIANVAVGTVRETHFATIVGARNGLVAYVAAQGLINAESWAHEGVEAAGVLYRTGQGQVAEARWTITDNRLAR